MPTFTVPIPGGGEYHVSASSQAAAYQNVGLAPPSGGGGGGGGGNPAAIGQNQYGDDIFNTPNGQKTGTQIMQELHSAGWDGQGNPVDVYNRTAGGGSSGTGGAASGAGIPGAVNPNGQAVGLGTAAGNFSAEASGVTAAELAERKREFDATLQRQMDMWEKQGQPQLVIQQRAQALAEQEYQTQLALASANLSLQQGQLGLNYLSQASQMGGPQNVFQQSNFIRGAQGNPQVPVFLQALQNNTRMPVFSATGNTPPIPQSLGGLAQQLSGQQSATPGFDFNQSLSAIQNLSNKGAQALKPGTLEQLSPDELSSLGSGLNMVGNTLPAFLQQYAQSRLGQQATGGDVGLAA